MFLNFRSAAYIRRDLKNKEHSKPDIFNFHTSIPLFHHFHKYEWNDVRFIRVELVSSENLDITIGQQLFRRADQALRINVLTLLAFVEGLIDIAARLHDLA